MVSTKSFLEKCRDLREMDNLARKMIAMAQNITAIVALVSD